MKAKVERQWVARSFGRWTYEDGRHFLEVYPTLHGYGYRHVWHLPEWMDVGPAKHAPDEEAAKRRALRLIHLKRNVNGGSR